MHYQNLLRTLGGALLIFVWSGCGSRDQPAAPAGPAARNAADVVNGMRLKQLTKTLELTEEQQQKLKALFASEAVQITQVDQDTSLATTDRTTRVTELKKGTQEKIKPLLTPEQLQKFEQLISKPQKKKKTN